MELSIEFKPNKRSSLYTIDRLNELLANLTKNKSIGWYSLSLAYETFETKVEILAADENEEKRRKKTDVA